MSISSIDLITMPPRTAEASSIAGREQNQLQHTGESIAGSFQKNVQQQGQRTVEANKSEKEEFRFDDSSSGNGASRRQGQKKKKKDAKEAPEAPRSNSSFDITI